MSMVKYNGYYIDLHDDDDFDDACAYLNQRFEDEISPYVVERYGPDDIDALNQAFNDWTDMLCKDGEISEKLYNECCRDGD